jgi:5-formyltetrahydrofolate cyclo-ligase
MGRYEKKLIRSEVLALRDSIDVEIRKAKDEKIKERLFELLEFKAAYKILLYASFRSEVNTSDLIKYCIAGGKVTALPRVDKENDELKLYEIKEIMEIATGYFGIPEPFVNEDRRIEAEDMDLIVVPGVAFDEQCNRLGYGKGFYDKLLEKVKYERQKSPSAFSHQPLACIIALAYEEQIVEAIPSELHDIRMDKIITDKRIIECKRVCHFGAKYG